MKKLNNLFTLLSALLLLGACEKDGDTYFLSSPEENELIASASSVVLTKETAKFYALSLAWTDQTLQVSDSRYQPTTGVQTSVQVSRTEDFSGQILETTESGVSKTYSVYTRPADYKGWKVPDILLSGHEAKIEETEVTSLLYTVMW